MLSPELLNLASTGIAIEFSERREHFSREVRQIQSGMALRGLAVSGAAQDAVRQALVRELEIRGLLAWQILSRVLSTQAFQVDPQLTQQLKDEVGRHIAEGCEDLATICRSASGPGSFGVIPPFATVQAAAVAKISSEIDLSMLAASARQVPTSSGNTVNIYQSYGIVQTGAGSVANLTQFLDAGTRTELQRALAAAEGAVDATADLSDSERTEVREIALEMKSELAADKPNVHKLRGLLLGLAIAIQALASAGPAYALLKAAAARVGVHLP